MKAYKIFNNDWTCNNFQYGVGKTYKLDDKPEMCSRGFHACLKAADCMRYYPPMPWQKFAVVELGGTIVGDAATSDKLCASEITIVKELSFSEFVEAIKEQRNTNHSEAVSESKAVNGSSAVNWSSAVSWSEAVNWSKAVNKSDAVNKSYAVNKSDAVNESFGVFNSKAINGSLFVASYEPQSLLFNRPVAKTRINEVHDELTKHLDGWLPQFNNLKQLYLANGSDWSATPIPNAKALQKEEAWADMPQAAIEYLRSLPEFDAGVFFEVTGIRVEKESSDER